MSEHSRAPLWRVVLTPPEALIPLFDAALEIDALSITLNEDGDGWRIEALFAADTDIAALRARLAVAGAAAGAAAPEVEIEPLADADWVLEARASVSAIRAGRYHIHGSHLTRDPAPGVIDIEIDAGLAFGSGEHESTRGCLLALDELAGGQPISRALDMGCGSGILAMAMAKTWGIPVVAADIDPIAVQTARDNAQANGCGDLIETIVADGYSHETIGEHAPYGLITANILAEPLIVMAPDLARRLAPHGIAVLAGLLARQEDAVVAAHGAAGLCLRRSIPLGDWRCLVLDSKGL